MNALLAIQWPFSEVFVERAGWVLVHSLWQFALLGLLAAALMRLMRQSSAEARTGVLIGLLVLSIGFPIVTSIVQSGGSTITAARPVVRRESPASDAPPIVDHPTVDQPVVDQPAAEQPIATSNLQSADETAEVSEAVGVSRASVFNTPDTARRSNWRDRATAILRPWLGWTVGFWGLGVVLCSLRPLVGWVTLRRLKRVGVSPPSNEVLASLARVSKRLGLRRSVQVLESSVAQVPLVIGYLWPVILLPVSLLTSIPATQLEAILAHESAHIRRHDFVVNLLQILIETLFFYHPAVWLLSHRIRIEREHCCDDLVVRTMNNRNDYGRALIAIEELRGRSSLLALGAADGSLLARVRRIAGHPTERTGLSAVTGLCLIACVIGVVVFLSAMQDGVIAAADDSRKPDESENADASHQTDEDRSADEPLPAGATLRFGTSRFRFGMPISNMAISVDGRLAVAASSNTMKARVFDLVSGRGLYSMNPWIEAAAISPDGRTIVTKGDFRLCIRDAANGKELRRIEMQRFNSRSANEWVAFTPDGKAIAVTSQGSVIHLIDFESGKTIRDFSNVNPESKLSSPFMSVLGIAFSQDAKLMASGGFIKGQVPGTCIARLWEVETGKELRRFLHTTRGYGIRSLAFSPDAKILATRSHDGCLRLFDVDTGKERKTFPRDGGGRKPGTVAFSPDGTTVAAAGDSIRLYDVATGEERLRIGASQAVNIQFTDGGKTLTGGHGGGICRWDTSTGKLLTPELGYSGVAQILATGDGSRVVTRGSSGDAHIWDGTNGMHLHKFHVAGWQQKLSMSPDGRFLAWAVPDGSIKLRDPDPNSRFADAPNHGSRILVYDIAANKYVNRFPGFKGDACDLSFSSNGRKLITIGHRDAVVRVWDFETGQEERSFPTAPDAGDPFSHLVNDAVFSADGGTVAVAGNPHVNRGMLGIRPPPPTQMWDVATGKEKYQLNTTSGRFSTSSAMAFSPDGRFFVSSSGIVVQAATGDRVAALPHEPRIEDLAFSRDGRFLATALSGDVIQVWEVATWTKRNEFKGHDRLTSLSFTPGGQLLSGGIDTTVLAWDLRPQATTNYSLEAAWSGLADQDSSKAFKAQGRFLAAPSDALKLFSAAIKHAQPLDVNLIQRLIADLDNSQSTERDSASKALSELGRRVKPFLEEAVKTAKSTEVQDRAKKILNDLQRVTRRQLRQMRAVRVLELIGDNESKNLLKKWSDGPPETLLTEEASAALQRLEGATKAKR